MNWKTRRTPRGHEYQSWPERRRRKQVVDEWVEQYGHVCPRCGARDVYPDGSDVQITADHVTPIAMGGSESGDLRVLCRRCQTTQAAQLAAMRRERHRG
jgi:5-methylcytosine-specific restriction endonuclease McrA